MLGYLWRTAPPLLRAALHRDGSLISRIERRVRLREIDPNLHMNQAVYAEVMELGRADWAIRSRAFSRWRAEGVKPVVAEQRIVYRHELRLRARYTIETRALAVEGRLLHMRTLLLRGDQVHASNDAKILFIGERGVLAAPETEALCEGFLVAPLVVEDWRTVAA